ncbi:uncharacterized protein BJ212DRAFT_1485438 [Suillus subaureus]|uniref:Uncharacterized protein n=1 Tax=Suillus subaureus TaxID=48587 RepID=A0A9P7J8F7_9AGAM|nr:uncharacterized protein BJ212DRAFT_1485438 [Suillus subaureus]KAG1807866.1 hypothetical protein BJ212DRAFT_1485438 [Suillus subaureus]
MACESNEYAQALLALARSQPSVSPTPHMTSASFMPPPHAYSGQHMWGDPSYATPQHQPLARSATVNSATGASAWGRDDHNVGLDYYDDHSGWSRGAQVALPLLPSAPSEPSTPTPTKGGAKRARAGTIAPKLRSAKKPCRSTAKATVEVKIVLSASFATSRSKVSRLTLVQLKVHKKPLVHKSTLHT